MAKGEKAGSPAFRSMEAIFPSAWGQRFAAWKADRRDRSKISWAMPRGSPSRRTQWGG